MGALFKYGVISYSSSAKRIAGAIIVTGKMTAMITNKLMTSNFSNFIADTSFFKIITLLFSR